MCINNVYNLKYQVETNDDIKRIILCQNLLTKEESDFAALMKVLFQKTARIQTAVIAPLKIILKCGICKELIIQVTLNSLLFYSIGYHH